MNADVFFAVVTAQALDPIRIVACGLCYAVFALSWKAGRRWIAAGILAVLWITVATTFNSLLHESFRGDELIASLTSTAIVIGIIWVLMRSLAAFRSKRNISRT